MGSAELRAKLYMPTLACIRFNPIIRDFYFHLVNDSGKIKKVAVVACMRKLLHIMFGVLKNQTPFKIPRNIAVEVKST